MITPVPVLRQRLILIQWNLVIKRSDITKPSYNNLKVILLVPALYISLFLYPDNEKPNITR